MLGANPTNGSFYPPMLATIPTMLGANPTMLVHTPTVALYCAGYRLSKEARSIGHERCPCEPRRVHSAVSPVPLQAPQPTGPRLRANSVTGCTTETSRSGCDPETSHAVRWTRHRHLCTFCGASSRLRMQLGPSKAVPLGPLWPVRDGQKSQPPDPCATQRKRHRDRQEADSSRTGFGGGFAVRGNVRPLWASQIVRMARPSSCAPQTHRYVQ